MKLEKALATQLLTAHPAQAAAALEPLSDDEIFSVLGVAPPGATATLLTRLAPQRASEVLSRIEGAMAEAVVEHLGLDAAAHLVRRLGPDAQAGFVDALAPEQREPLRALLAFPPGTAGALMDSRVLAVPEDVTVAEAVRRIRKAPDHVRYNVYVVDREQRLVGVLNLRELLLADGQKTLASIANRDVLSVLADADRAAVRAHPAWREAHSLPVVDRSGTYLGAIRYRTWRRLEDEADAARGRHDTTTTAALGSLLVTGMVGAMGALTDLAVRTPGGPVDDRG
ncbi:MAG TPA: CBS domain-containing protein [Longimicrobiales bacterium]|nr:CBS domain-containing protein [Longimicrobiales bacterium]